MASILQLAAISAIVALASAQEQVEVNRDKRQLLVDPVVDAIDPFVRPVVYRRPSVIIQRPYFPGYYAPSPFLRAYRPFYSSVIPAAPVVYPRPAVVAAPALVPAPVPVAAAVPAAVATDIIVKKHKM